MLDVVKYITDFNYRQILQLRETVKQIRQQEVKAWSQEKIIDFTRTQQKLLHNKTSTPHSTRIKAFAIVAECIRRVFSINVYDVQLMGALVLDQGQIAEMNTGEGKTLVATLPSYLNALHGNGVHVVTANDYLVQRDAEYLKPLYDYLGISISMVTGKSSVTERQKAYKHDITYVTSTELGFDYLRDNTADSIENQVLPSSFNYCIVDEVDYLLIDEASTPLVLSSVGGMPNSYYRIFNNFVSSLDEGDCTIKLKDNTVALTEEGYEKLKKFVTCQKICKSATDLYDRDVDLFYYINACLKAHYLFTKEKDYLVKNKEVLTVSSKTGRVLKGRRWGKGIHQAIEAKEGCPIRDESTTIASVTIQNFFKYYRKLSGMTGTASSQSIEFQEIYNLSVIAIPPHKTLRRVRHEDQLFISENAKLHYIANLTKRCIDKNQPVLIGCSVISTSEKLSNILRKFSIQHKVLNAKYVEQESMIISNAGYPGAVTIATNMAGRGTDILLGGVDKNADKRKQVVNSGGLMVIVAERHKSRRIDNQLIGRCARQGDPGECCIVMSLEDEFLTLFGGDKFKELKDQITLEEEDDGTPVSMPFLGNIVSYAQDQVEERNVGMRKRATEYDNVINMQRNYIYKKRQSILEINSIEGINSVLMSLLKTLMSDEKSRHSIAKLFSLTDSKPTTLAAYVTSVLSPNQSRSFTKERTCLLYYFNVYWQEYINSIEDTRLIANLVSYGQRDPKNEFKKKTVERFITMINSMIRVILETVVTSIESRIQYEQ